MSWSRRTMAAITIAVGLVAALAGMSPATAQSAKAAADGPRRIQSLPPGMDLPGFDYQVLRNVPQAACEEACIGDAACKAFTFNTRSNWCFLKTDSGTPRPYRDAASGRVIGSVAATPASAPLPLPNLDFLPDDVPSDADSFRAEINAAARLQRDTETVGAGLAAAILNGGANGWLSLSNQLLSEQTDDYGRKQALRTDGLSAAFLGLKLATDKGQQAHALVLMSLAFEADSRWRPAIDSLKAALALSPKDAAIKAHYEELRADYGFRILDYSVNTDTASPRMCVQFSEALPKGRVDFSKYVAVAGMTNPAVTTTAQELCIDGLEHGERYDVTIRAGLPSTVGETLTSAASYTIYVRDRKPTARFPTSAYVLPRTGAVGVPLISVNTDMVMLDLLRVGDRGLARSVAGGDFRRQLSPYDIETLANTTGAKVWSGEMKVERQLNKEVTTAFPVDEAVKTLDPGVYVLVARPREIPSENWDQRATQWFIVSDLGIASISAADGVHAFVRSLGTAKPMAGVDVRLVARNDEVLGTAKTDAAGHAVFAPGLGRGTGGMAPAVLVATAAGGDYGFLDLSAPGFDLTDRGVAGRPAPGPLDAFLYTERGVYRAGETVHLTALLRDGASKAASGVPLTISVTRPDGVIYRKVQADDEGLGGRSLDIDLIPSAMRGTWRAEAFSDPKAAAIGAVTFLVEDFVPERMKVDLKTDATAIAAGKPATIAVAADFLYGAPASNLAVEGEIAVKPSEDGVAGFPGYRFGLADDDFTPVRRPLFDLGRTDAAGKATVTASLPTLDLTTKPLVADIAVRVREPGGRAVERTVTLPVAPPGPRVGVKPLFSGDQVGEGATAGFEVAAVGPDGARTALAGASWQLLKVRREFQWFNRDGNWDYFTTTSTERVAEGKLDLTATDVGRISAPVDWGTFRLEISVPNVPTAATSYEFAAGWVTVGATAETPDVLEIGLDKPGYKPGDTARLNIAPRFAGTALIAVVGDGVRELRAVDVPAGGTTIPLKVGNDWTPGTYVTAMLYRPMDVAAKRMPSRAIGLNWLSIDRSIGSLTVTLGTPAEMRPRGPLKVPVTVAGLKPGEEAYVTLAAVDVGILNLTRYEAPDAAGFFLGQRRLGAEIRDLYGALIDSLGATRGTIRTGGDESGAFAPTDVPTQELVANFAGPIKVDASGHAEASFDIPAFNGTVRVMAVAWSASKVGNASSDVVVRDPVVVTGSLPRVMAPGDDSRMRLDFDNVSGPAGDYRLTVTASGPAGLGKVPQTVRLDAGGKASLDVPLTTNGVGIATVAVELAAPGGETFAQAFRLNVRPAAPPVMRRSIEVLAKNGGELSFGQDYLAGLVPETASLSVSVSAGVGLDVAGLLGMLDRYPYGCAEQTTSTALPLLYFDQVAASIGMGGKDDIHKRVEAAIARLMQFQNSSGSFGLWGPGGGDLWLNAYVTDFLTRARAAGYVVPEGAFTLALDRLQNDVSYNANFDNGGGGGLAYALYVLARNGRASIGDLRYFADDRIGDFGSGLSQAQIAAGLALYGDDSRAKATFTTAAATLASDSMGGEQASWSDYGTPVRNAAAALTLVAEAGIDSSAIPGLDDTLSASRAGGETPSTQEAAWMLLAANALGAGNKALKIDVDGGRETGAVFRRLEGYQLAGAPLVLRNAGTDDAAVALTVSGVPLEPEPAAASGLSIERDYYHLDGTPADPASVRQNERLVVVLTVRSDEPQDQANLMIADLLPGGFEVENPELVSSADLAAFPWLPQDSPAHTEFRDDRFVAAFEPGTDLARGVTVAYMVRAVTPGRFAHPAALAEDMYRPELFARTAPGEVVVKAAQ